MKESTPPARVPSPGQILSMELEERGWTQGDLAEIMRRPAQAVSEIINARKQITPATALELGEALGTSAEFWLNLEGNYRLHLARKKPGQLSEVARRSRLNELVPLSELKKRGWIRPVDDTIEALERAVCGFLRIDSPVELPRAAANLRSSQAYAPEQSSQIAWLMRVQQLAEAEPSTGPDLSGLANDLPELLSLSTEAALAPEVPDFLSRYGVTMKVVPHLPRTYVDGAAFHLEGKPVLALSLRYNRIDNYWFTLLHELAHLLLGHEDVFFESVEPSKDDRLSQRESAANDWARDMLIPPESYEGFVASGRLTGPSVREFAAQIKRHPGIIVGRLHHDEHLPYNRLRNLLQKVDPLAFDSR